MEMIKKIIFVIAIVFTGIFCYHFINNKKAIDNVKIQTLNDRRSFNDCQNKCYNDCFETNSAGNNNIAGCTKYCSSSNCPNGYDYDASKY